MAQDDYDVIGVETNTLYMMSQAMDLIFRDCERRMAAHKEEFKREKKQKFTRYMTLARQASLINEDLAQDIYEHESKRKWKDVQIWQEQANELARLILMYADRSRYIDFVNEIFKHIRSFKGDEIITEDVLQKFYLKKL